MASQIEQAHNAIQLSGSYQNSAAIPVNSCGQHTVHISYDPDTVDGTTILNTRIQLSPDGGKTWVTWRPFELSSGTYTIGPDNFPIVANDSDKTSTVVVYGDATHLRVSVKESGSPGDFGNASVWVVSRSPS